MDAKQFDTIAKAMISASSRHQMLGGLLAGVLGRLGLTHADDADAPK
jgi:hypothetical protein